MGVSAVLDRCYRIKIRSRIQKKKPQDPHGILRLQTARSVYTGVKPVDDSHLIFNNNTLNHTLFGWPAVIHADFLTGANRSGYGFASCINNVRGCA